MMTRIGLFSRGVETNKSHFRVKAILDIAKSVRRRKTELDIHSSISRQERQKLIAFS